LPEFQGSRPVSGINLPEFQGSRPVSGINLPEFQESAQNHAFGYKISCFFNKNQACIKQK
jgi:hypothetical protein